jgi:hypothetical protein
MAAARDARARQTPIIAARGATGARLSGVE